MIVQIIPMKNIATTLTVRNDSINRFVNSYYQMGVNVLL